jgi:hypothetical protein
MAKEQTTRMVVCKPLSWMERSQGKQHQVWDIGYSSQHEKGADHDAFLTQIKSVLTIHKPTFLKVLCISLWIIIERSD